MAHSLEKEFQYYLDHQSELIKQYNGKHIVIADGQVIGAYSTEKEAIESTIATRELGTFLVQKCEPGKDGYTQTFHSRVVFV